MSQTTRVIRTNPPPPPELPARPLSPTQHKQAVQLVDKASKQRLQLGAELLHAAQAQASRAKAVFDQVRAEQNTLKEELQNDLASSLQTYDQWMAQFDQRFTARLKSIEDRVDALSDQWSAVEQRIVALVGRAETLLDHMRQQPPPAADRAPQPTAQPKADPMPSAEVPPQDQPDTPPVPALKLAQSTTDDDAEPSTETLAPPKPAKTHDLVFSKVLEQLREVDKLGHNTSQPDGAEPEA